MHPKGMKVLKIGSFLLIMAIAGVGAAMAVTNPGQDAYEEYAVEQLSEQLNERVCSDAPVFLSNACESILEDNQNWIRELVASETERQNFIFLSLYTTELSSNDVINQVLPPTFSLSVENLPSYHFETVGVFRKFYTYRAERN
jgi:hypothetical protein